MIRQAQQAIASVAWSQVVEWLTRGLTVLGSALLGLLLWQGQTVLHQLDAHDQAIRANQLSIIRLAETSYTQREAAADMLAMRKAMTERPPWVVDSLSTIKESIGELRQELRDERKRREGNGGI